MTLSPKQAAKALGIEISLLRKYLRANVFPGAYKERGTRWVIPQDDVIAFRDGKLKVGGAFKK